MVDFASLEVQADVPETSLAAVQQGAPASVYLDAFPDRLYTGRVSRVWPTADKQKATVEVRVVLDEPDERLRPEMGVRIVFRQDEAQEGGGYGAKPTDAIAAAGIPSYFALSMSCAMVIPPASRMACTP